MLILTGTVVVGQAGYYFILDLCLRVNSRPLSLEDFIESSRSLEPTTIKKELIPVPLFLVYTLDILKFKFYQVFLLLDIKHKTYAKSKPQQQKNWLPKVSVYANRLKIKNVSILFNLLIGETIFFFGISKNPAATQFDCGLFDRYVTTKTKQFSSTLFNATLYCWNMRVLILIRI